MARLAAPVDPARFEVERVTAYPSKTAPGCRCSSFIAKGLARDGTARRCSTGYGGFNINMTPAWTPSAIPVARARRHLRAGRSCAAAASTARPGTRPACWASKQNVFDDFIAAAEWLIAEQGHRARAPGDLRAARNGGLLVGAALTQRPELFRAVVCGVPLLDMLRYHRFRIAALWIPEYGSPDDPEQSAGCTPTRRITTCATGSSYPAVLLHTAASDTRVDPMHARKMAARLQAASTPASARSCCASRARPATAPASRWAR